MVVLPPSLANKLVELVLAPGFQQPVESALLQCHALLHNLNHLVGEHYDRPPIHFFVLSTPQSDSLCRGFQLRIFARDFGIMCLWSL